MTIQLTHNSVVHLGAQLPSRILFPGKTRWLGLNGSSGYVRSQLRVDSSWRARQQSVPERLPWRDYPDDVLTERSEIHFPGGSGYELIVSARNCCNEFGSSCRLDGDWCGRDGDPEIPQNWPVLLVENCAARLVTLSEAEQVEGGIVTGMPLVMSAGRAIDRDFVIANASDVAHSYRVDPYARFGPSAPAWQELSDTWVAGKDDGVDDTALAKRMQAVADSHCAEESDRLLHSILAQRTDGTLMIVGVHGALHRIAAWLVRRFDVERAILLDNSGSVGWSYREPGDREERILLAGPNQRSKGTVFLAFDTGGHPRAAQAIELNR